MGKPSELRHVTHESTTGTNCSGIHSKENADPMVETPPVVLPQPGPIVGGALVGVGGVVVMQGLSSCCDDEELSNF